MAMPVDIDPKREGSEMNGSWLRWSRERPRAAGDVVVTS
jgi:hypothetical protein